MEIDRPRRWGTVRYVVLIILLAAIAAVLVMVVSVSARRAEVVDETARKGLYYVASISLALLGVTVVALVWIMVRFIAYRIRPRTRRTPTAYVDAWSLAGQRYRLDDDKQGRNDTDDDADPKGDED